jgi:PAS domain S-box-containing protein
MVQHLDVAFARIWTLSGDGNVLELQASAGLYTHLDGAHSRVPVGALEIGLIAQQRKPHFSTNVVQDSRVSDHEWARREGMVSFAGYPLVVDDRLVGVMGMFGRAQFSDETLDTLGSVSRQIAVGIERKRVEDQLRSNEERTRFALGAARMGVWEVDLVTDRLVWSETMAAVFGLRPEQAPTTSQAFVELIHPEDRALVESAMRRAATGGDFAVEFRVVWSDGSTHWVRGRAAIVRDANGKPAYLRGVVMDISDQKLLEEQFRQVQKMEAVGQLAGGVAHDFNNLLTAILGYTDLIADQLEPSSAIRTDIDEIRKAGERAAGLTRQLLAFSRKQVVQPSLVNLSTLVDGTSHMLQRLIGEQIRVALALAADLAPVRADAGQIEQILMNLAVNARDAMPMGGQLTIETANVQLDDSYPDLERQGNVEPGPYVMLAVTDSGLGMNAETRRRLFEPFFTTKERGKGTGLGLATVHSIVKQSSGYVWVYSEVGSGTTFKIFLPRAEGSTDDAKRPAATQTPAIGSETVLLVEDEEAVRALSRVMLERAGYQVWDAPNPVEAEALFARLGSSIDLLVTDVILPGFTGPALFQRLSRECPELKVLYVSGYTDAALGHGGELDPEESFLQKPFTFDGLTRKVREALDR